MRFMLCGGVDAVKERKQIDLCDDSHLFYYYKFISAGYNEINETGGDSKPKDVCNWPGECMV